mgnify:FL=1
MPLLISSIAGLSTVLGSVVIFKKWKREQINKFITFCLSLSLIIMIGISITELIPEASLSILIRYKLVKGIFLAVVVFAIGIFSVYFLNRKIEKSSGSDLDLYRLGILSMLALMLHNLPEGIVTFLSSYQNMELGFKISLAIMLHNIPEGISIAVPIYYATGSKKKAVFMTFLSGLAEPLGAFLAFVFLRKFITDTMIGFILVFVAGLMITLAIHELLPKALKYHENSYILLGFLLGILLLFINHFVF